MKYLSLVALTILALAVSSCTKGTCSNFVSSKTCPNTCTWTGDVCQAPPAVCAEIKDEGFCSTQVFNNVGCVWNGTACASATTCEQPKSAKTCIGSTLLGTSCFWSGTACSTNAPVGTCADNTTAPDCDAANCFWTGTACSDALVQCSDITAETLCSKTVLESGCYWTDTACAESDECSQPTTEAACLATKQGAERCSWSGNACYLNTIQPCLAFTTETSCESTSGSDGQCYWTGTACHVATQCSQLLSAPICTNSSLKADGSLCNWTFNGQACTVNDQLQCTLNGNFFFATACCAGSDTSCVRNDANCAAFGSPAGMVCRTNPEPKCTLNTGIASAPAACCSGTNTTCTTTNPNCTLVDTLDGGSCS